MRSSLIASLVLVAANAAAASVWEPGPSLPAPKQHAFGVLHGGALYAIGGTPWVNRGDQDGSVYALVQGSWTVAAPLDGTGPTVPVGGGVDALGRIVFFGGLSIDNGDTGKNKIYDPLEGPQANIAEPPDGVEQLGFAFATDDLGRLYWLGGGESPASSGVCVRYAATTDTWATLAPMPSPVRDACACFDGAGHVLVLGGIPNGSSSPTADVKRFDVVSGTWSTTLVPDLPTPVSGARAVLGADNRIYVVGGVGADGTVRDAVVALNLATNTWSPAAPLATARSRCALVRGDDDFLYAIGGTDAGGAALSSVERLFTSVCPAIPDPPATTSVWLGQTAALLATVTGSGSITYAWSRDGTALADGPTGTGSVLAGTGTSQLLIQNVGTADAGTYDVSATNDCGSVSGPVASLTIATPPAVPEHWTVTMLHPSWAKASSATCLSGDRQGGSVTVDVGGYNNITAPVTWHGSADSVLDLTPPGSVGGGIADIDGDTAVGWWWWPYQCYISGQWYTCYSAQAAAWVGEPATFTNLQWGGWEYSSANVVRNGVIGGSVTNDDAVGNIWSHALLWGIGPYSGVDLHPVGTSSSSVSALDGDHQYGSVLTPYPGPTYHAAMWSGSWTSFVDLHPVGASASHIVDAADGLQVGYAGYPYDGAKACLWGGTAASFMSLHPTGATLSHASCVAQGVVLGDATIGGVTSVGWWALGSNAFTSLADELTPEGFSSVTVAEMRIAPDGTFTLVGAGFRTAAARWEALMWVGDSATPGDIDGNGVVNAADLALLLGAWGTSDPAADLDGDATVGGTDLTILLGAWSP